MQGHGQAIKLSNRPIVENNAHGHQFLMEEQVMCTAARNKTTM